MADTDIATIGLAVDTSGLDKGTAAMGAAEKAAASLEKQATSATAALERMAKANADAFAKTGSAAMGGGSGGMYGPAWQQSLAGGTSGYLGLAAAAKEAAGATLGHTAAMTAGASGITAHSVGLGAVARALDDTTQATGKGTEALAKGTAAHKAHGAAAYGNRLQLMEFAHVGRALFDELAAGGSILRGLTMEFGRLQLAVSSGEGGVMGALGRIGGVAARFANPAALAGGAAAAAAAASVYGFSRYEEGQEALERSLNGRGRASGMTQAQLNALARDSASASGLSTSEGVGLMARYTGAGLSGDLSGRLTEASREFGRITGEGTDKGAETLSKAFVDPIRGLGELDRSLGFVDARLKDQIEDLVHSGQIGRAQALEMEALNKAMHGATDSTFSFSKSLNSAGNWISDRFSSLGHGVANALGYGSDEDNLEKNRGILKQLQGFDPVGNAPDIATTKAEIARLEAKIQQANVTAAANARDQRERDLSGPITAAVRTVLPELERARSAADTLGLLRDALNDRDIQRFVSPDVYASLGRAYGNTAMMARMNAPGVADRQNYDLSLSRIRDSGVEDQGLNVARRAELEILRQTGDVVRATTAAQRAYNLELASAQERADEMARSTRQRLDLVGLSPFDRAMKEVDQKYLGPRGLIESYRLDKGAADVMADKDIRGDLAGAAGLGPARLAVTGFSDALDGAAKRLAAFPPAGAGPFGALSPMKPNDAVGPFNPVPFTGSAGPVSDHERTMVDMLVKAGFTNRAADAGYVGGMAGESGPGLDPTAHNASGHRGIEQWEPSRFAGASAFGDPNAFLSQAQLVIRELQTSESAAGAMLRNATTIQGGLAANLRAERPSQDEIASSYNKRLAYGTALGADLAGLTPRRDAGVVELPPIEVHGGRGAAEAAAGSVKPIAYDGSDKMVQSYRNEQAGVLKSYGSTDPDAYGTPYGDATRRLKEQSAMLDVQASSFGKSEAAIKGAAAAQGLWASYLDAGWTKTVKLSEATGDLADRVRLYGSEAERVAQQQEDQARRQKEVVDAADFSRSSISSVFTSGLTSMAHGRSFGDAAKSTLSGIGDQLIGKGVSAITGSLLGGQGSGFGGLLGSLFGGLSHYATGTEDARGGLTEVGENGPELVQMPAHAQVMSNGEAKGLMGASRAPNITVGGATFVASGEGAFSQRQMDTLAAQHAETQQKIASDLVRNFSQYQSDARQTG